MCKVFGDGGAVMSKLLISTSDHRSDHGKPSLHQAQCRYTVACCAVHNGSAAACDSAADPSLVVEKVHFRAEDPAPTHLPCPTHPPTLASTCLIVWSSFLRHIRRSFYELIHLDVIMNTSNGQTMGRFAMQISHCTERGALKTKLL